MYPLSMFLAKNRKITFFHLKIIVFIAVKNCSILHGHAFVMHSPYQHAHGHSLISLALLLGQMKLFSLGHP